MWTINGIPFILWGGGWNEIVLSVCCRIKSVVKKIIQRVVVELI